MLVFVLTFYKKKQLASINKKMYQTIPSHEDVQVKVRVEEIENVENVENSCLCCIFLEWLLCFD